MALYGQEDRDIVAWLDGVSALVVEPPITEGTIRKDIETLLQCFDFAESIRNI